MNENNYTLSKILRVGINPLASMIGLSSYYGQQLSNPILGSINSLLFGKKLGLDIWNLNQTPNTKTKLINSSKKILLGLGTISLINYSRFIDTNISPLEPTTTPLPFTSTLPTTTTLATTTTTLATTTTTESPFNIMLNNYNINNENSLVDWDTFLSLNIYGLTNLISGISELIPNNYSLIRKICNIATGGALISTGTAIGINNGFNNASAIPTIVAGVSEIIHNLLPMETTNNIELEETSFINDTVPIINNMIDEPRVYNSITEPLYNDNFNQLVSSAEFSDIDISCELTMNRNYYAL